MIKGKMSAGLTRAHTSTRLSRTYVAKQAETPNFEKL